MHVCALLPSPSLPLAALPHATPPPIYLFPWRVACVGQQRGACVGQPMRALHSKLGCSCHLLFVFALASLCILILHVVFSCAACVRPRPTVCTGSAPVASSLPFFIELKPRQKNCYDIPAAGNVLAAKFTDLVGWRSGCKVVRVRGRRYASGAAKKTIWTQLARLRQGDSHGRRVGEEDVWDVLDDWVCSRVLYLIGLSLC